MEDLLDGSELEKKVKQEIFGGDYYRLHGEIYDFHQTGVEWEMNRLTLLAKEGPGRWYFQYAQLIDEKGEREAAEDSNRRFVNPRLDPDIRYGPRLSRENEEVFQRLWADPRLQTVGATFYRVKNLLEKAEEEARRNHEPDPVYFSLSTLFFECKRILWFVARTKQFPEGLHIPEGLRRIAETPLAGPYKVVANDLEERIEGLSFIAEEVPGVEEIRHFIEDPRGIPNINPIVEAIHKDDIPHLNILRPCIQQTLRITTHLYRIIPPLSLEEKQRLLKSVAKGLGRLLNDEGPRPDCRLFLRELREEILGLDIRPEPIIRAAFNNQRAGSRRVRRSSRRFTRRRRHLQ
jgi:hypothetical protein